MKRAFDLVAAALGLLVLSPVFLVVALVVKLNSWGPVLFHPTRSGQGGRPFRLHKFRTMTDGAPGPAITAGHDPRVTRVGRVLRRTHLDELPQLWNVLVGEMSLVGPRPEDPRFVDREDPSWRRVLAVRPGITGPAQLEFSGREEALLGADPERDYRERVLPAKLRADLGYVAGGTLDGDVAILVRTAFHVLGVRR